MLQHSSKVLVMMDTDDREFSSWMIAASVYDDDKNFFSIC
jgi:hypothetical protein